MADRGADRAEGGRVPWAVWVLILALALLSIGWVFRFPW
jgi:hypothetical protein